MPIHIRHAIESLVCVQTLIFSSGGLSLSSPDEIIPFFAEDYYKEYAYYDFASIKYDAFGEMSVYGNGRVSSGRGESFTGQEYQNAQVGPDNVGLNMYDFGARFYDPSSARWTTIDPLAEKYYSTSPYAYALNNPVNAIDVGGELVIFINGMHVGSGGSPKYWGDFDDAVMKHLNDYNARYYDGSVGGLAGLLRPGIINNIDVSYRYDHGYDAGMIDASSILGQLANGETIKVITHSMGAAYAKGFIQALIDQGVSPSAIAFEADFAPFQVELQEAIDGVDTFQFSNKHDRIANNRFLGSSPGRIEGTLIYDLNDDRALGHYVIDFFDQINALPQGKYRFEDGKIVPY